MSQELKSMVEPYTHTQGRASLGFEGSVGEYFFIDIEKLMPFSQQPRKIFAEEEIKDLASSIKTHGIRQPLTIIQSSNVEGKYEIVSGERRYRAAKMIDLKKIPCIILDDTAKAEEIAIIENLHRENLHPVELGMACKKLLENTHSWGGQKELANMLSLSESAISEAIKYTELDDEVKDYVILNNIKSRDILRKLLTYRGDKEKQLSILGITKSFPLAKKSVLRVYMDKGDFKIQKKSILSLNKEEKLKLKDELWQIIEFLDKET